MSRSFDVRLHIGAHKTATTHLQDTLNLNKSALFQSGCIYLPREFIRQGSLVTAVHANHLKRTRGLASARTFDQFLRVPADYPARILVSEEDILGMSIDLLNGVYPQAGQRLLPWSALSGGQMSVFLSVRNYANILPSAYCQALRDGAVPRPFGAYRTEWTANCPSWVNLVATMIEQFGKSRVTVWTMEGYLKGPDLVMQALSGVQLPEVLDTTPGETRRLSTSTVQKIESLDPSLSKAARVEAVQALVRDGNWDDPFDPLSDADKEILSCRYREDVDRIRQMGVTFLG